MTEPSARNLRSCLQTMGAELVDQSGDGAFRNEVHEVDGLRIALQADYGAWRATLSYQGRPYFPASFWLTALSGSSRMPVPAVTDEDLPRLAGCLDRVVAQAAALSPLVEAMGEDYRAAMREGLS